MEGALADEIKSLYLSVDASVEALRRNLAAGERALDAFEGSTRSSAKRVDDAIGKMGGRFGTFADLAKSAADKAQQSFEASFSQIERMAARAVTAPRSAGGALSVDVAGARDAAAAARNEAVGLREIAAAAERAALKVGDTSTATRLYVQAANAAAIEAEQQARALGQQAGALERLQIELDQAGSKTTQYVAEVRAARAELQALSAQSFFEAPAQSRLSGKSAAASAEVFQEYERMAAAGQRLRAELDPLYAAQVRFDEELGQAQRLLQAGVISTETYALAEQRAERALAGHIVAQQRGAVSAGQLRAGTQQLSAFLDSVRETPFAWGRHDCCTFAAGAVEAMTGADPMPEFRGRYTTARGSVYALRKFGAGTLAATLTAKFGEPMPQALAQRGDLVMAGGSIGIGFGAVGLFVGVESVEGVDGERDGLVRIVRPADGWERAWRVPFEGVA